MKLIGIRPSTNKDKKLMATFEEKGREKTIHFGAKGLMDYTKYYKQDKEVAKVKRDAYLARHRNENWNDPTTAGSLSRWILWNMPTVEESVKDFKKKFNL